MALDFTALESEITRDADVNSSASSLLAQLFAEVEANKNNPAKIQEIVDRVKANNDALSAAVAANTPGSTPAPA